MPRNTSLDFARFRWPVSSSFLSEATGKTICSAGHVLTNCVRCQDPSFPPSNGALCHDWQARQSLPQGRSRAPASPSDPEALPRVKAEFFAKLVFGAQQ